MASVPRAPLAERGLGPDLELLADSTRVRMLALLEADELSVGELARGLSTPQPTISRHLKALTQDDWVTRRAVGSTSYLRLAPLDLQRHALWSLVKADATRERDFGSDRERMAFILAERADGRAFFERMADGWDVLRDQLFGRRFLVPTMAAMLPPDQTVVDLGCGTGELLSHLAPAIGSGIGIDREPSMLDIARRRLADHPHVRIVEAALESVPLAQASTDLALIVLVLHHVPEPASVLAEAARILRPGGRLVLVDMQPHDATAWRAFGHVHQGFSQDDLDRLASSASLALTRHQLLAPDPDVQGPPLFLATLTPKSPRKGKR